MRHIFLPLFVVLLCLHGNAQKQSKIISVADFGAIANSGNDATTAIAKAIAACKKFQASVLYFPKGRYDIYPDSAVKKVYYISNTSTKDECPDKTKTIGLYFNGIKNLTVEGNGSEFIFHDKMITFCFDNCENIQLKNLEEDYARPTMSEIQFTSVTPDAITAKVHPDSKYKIENGKLIWYDTHWQSRYFHAIMIDTSTNHVTYSSWQPLLKCNTKEISPNVVVFENPVNFQPKVGNVLTIRDIIRDEVGVFILHTRNITFQNVALHYMHGLGAVSQFSENITMKNVQCAPKAGSGRYMASSADFMHFSGCKGLIKIENCLFSGAHDDPINVHGTHLRIIKTISANKVLARFMHGQSYGFDAFSKNDSVEFIHAKSLLSFSKNIVKAVEKINETDVELTLQQPIPQNMQPNDCIENTTCTPSVEIKNCIFTRANTRGILVTTRRKVVIENNIFKQVGMNAILISDDAQSWFESGMVKDVTIKNNVFNDCGYNGGAGNAAAIAIAPENDTVNYKLPVHNNINVSNNLFEIKNGVAVFAKSTQGLVIKNNVVKPLNSGFKNQPLFQFVGCNDVKLISNKCPFDNKTFKDYIIERMPETGITEN